ncbi:uncharacterized protein [Watersipora subatra]|uniref:uncharacterized protein n=1 Tax=Watersipora subatra TaxID=2589382 RepID=UPI00355B1635
MAGVTLSKSKCKFGQKSVEFFGYIISKEGISTGPRIQGIQDFPTLTFVTAVRSFFGLANQYACFSEKLAEKSASLRALLMTDASNQGLGATLSQVQGDGTSKLVAAASISLNETEQCYAAIKKEALGVCWAMEKFSHYVLGMKDVTSETDHKALIPLFGNQFLDKLPPRIQGFKLRLQRFYYDIKYVSKIGNKAADALSRYNTRELEQSDIVRVEVIESYVQESLHWNGSCDRLEKFKVEQREDETLRQVIHYVEQGWPVYLSSMDTILRPYFERRGLLIMNKRLLMLGMRLVVPLSQRSQVFEDIHKGHLGITKCQARARNGLWWSSMAKAIECLTTDPQYSSEEFQKFAKAYEFTHVTSSPKYTRSKGAAERAVATVKSLLSKEKDPYIAILAYKASPQLGVYSPAELLMGRMLKTTVVVHPDSQMPKLLDYEKLKAKNELYKERMKMSHDINPKVKDLPAVCSGDCVMVRDSSQEGTVVRANQDGDRKVITEGDNGQHLVRNRSAVISVSDSTVNAEKRRVSVRSAMTATLRMSMQLRQQPDKYEG